MRRRALPGVARARRGARRRHRSAPAPLAPRRMPGLCPARRPDGARRRAAPARPARALPVRAAADRASRARRPRRRGLPWATAAVAVAALAFAGVSPPRGGAPDRLDEALPASGAYRHSVVPFRLPIGQRSAADDFVARASRPSSGRRTGRRLAPRRADPVAPHASCVGGRGWIAVTVPLDHDRFDVLTFDCYGTLIDWESGLLAALRRALPGARRRGGRRAARVVRPPRGGRRAPARTGPIATSSPRVVRGVAADNGVEVADDAVAAFSESVRRLAGVPGLAPARSRGCTSGSGSA